MEKKVVLNTLPTVFISETSNESWRKLQFLHQTLAGVVLPHCNTPAVDTWRSLFSATFTITHTSFRSPEFYSWALRVCHLLLGETGERGWRERTSAACLPVLLVARGERKAASLAIGCRARGWRNTCWGNVAGSSIWSLHGEAWRPYWCLRIYPLGTPAS